MILLYALMQVKYSDILRYIVRKISGRPLTQHVGVGLCSHFVPGRSAGYPSAPHTVPYVKVSLIRFLGSHRLYTNGKPNRPHPVWRITLLPCRLSTCSAIPCCFVNTVCDLKVSPIFPPRWTLCPASPSLKWVPWTSVPHPIDQVSLLWPSVLWSAKTSNCPSQIPSLFALGPRYLACFHSFVCSIQDSLVARKLASSARAFDLPVIPTIWVSLHKETAGYLPSSQVTPMTACPGLSPRWCPVYIALAYPELLPSACVECVGFLNGVLDVSYVSFRWADGRYKTLGVILRSGKPLISTNQLFI